MELILSRWYNFNINRVFNLKMIWEPLNCGSFFEKIYLRLHENVLKNSLKIVYERIKAFQTRGRSYLNECRLLLIF